MEGGDVQHRFDGLDLINGLVRNLALLRVGCYVHIHGPSLIHSNCQVRNNLEAGVVEPAISKVKSLRFATEATVTILRIDDLIKLSPKQDQDPVSRGHAVGR